MLAESHGKPQTSSCELGFVTLRGNEGKMNSRMGGTDPAYCLISFSLLFLREVMEAHHFQYGDVSVTEANLVACCCPEVRRCPQLFNLRARAELTCCLCPPGVKKC